MNGRFLRYCCGASGSDSFTPILFHPRDSRDRDTFRARAYRGLGARGNGMPHWLRGSAVARTTPAKSREASHCMEREGHRTMIPTSSAEAQRSRGEDSRVGRLDSPFLSRPRSLSDKRGNATRPESFHPKGIRRLSIAIINHAILDLLENGRHSLGAEHWLLSREFEGIHNWLG